MRLADMPPEVLSERLGHASIETTKIYTRPAELARAAPRPAMPWQQPAQPWFLRRAIGDLLAEFRSL